MSPARQCLVCGRNEALRELVLVSDRNLGLACRERCTVLLWEAWFVRATGGDAYDHAMVLWQWRRRRAEVEGQPFDEEPPKSATELATEIQVLTFCQRGAA